MSSVNISSIQNDIDEVNFIIKKFLIDTNDGVEAKLDGLDDKVATICAGIKDLSKAEFEPLRPAFEDSLNKVRELKQFLSNQLEETGAKINLMTRASIASKRYTDAANDNL